VVGALTAFTDGLERQIDVAEVNGRLFLNYRDEKLRTLLDTAREVLSPAAAASGFLEVGVERSARRGGRSEISLRDQPGRRTRLITWMTPLDAPTSAVVTRAPLT